MREAMNEPEFAAGIYLTYSPSDKAEANLVKKKLADRGVHVEFYNYSSKKQSPDFMRNAMVQSKAVVVLATSKSIQSNMQAFDVGAALALDKPILVLTKDVTAASLPSYLKDYRVYPMKSIDKMIDDINPEKAS